VLLFNEESGQVAFRPADEHAPHAYRIRENGVNREISGRVFLKHFRIDFPQRPIHFDCRWDDQLGALIIAEPVQTPESTPENETHE